MTTTAAAAWNGNWIRILFDAVVAGAGWCNCPTRSVPPPEKQEKCCQLGGNGGLNAPPLQIRTCALRMHAAHCPPGWTERGRRRRRRRRRRRKRRFEIAWSETMKHFYPFIEPLVRDETSSCPFRGKFFRFSSTQPLPPPSFIDRWNRRG